MNEKEHDCPTCADWDRKKHGCTAVIHGGTPCVNWRPKETDTEDTDDAE